MEIHLHTDHNIQGREALAAEVTERVESRLERFADRLTRVEVHLGDESAGRSSGADIRCMLEARPAGADPVAVTSHAPTVDGAVGGAIGKLTRVLESQFGRRDHTKGSDTIRGEEKS